MSSTILVLKGCFIYYSITMDNELLSYSCNQRSKLYRTAWWLFDFTTKKIFKILVLLLSHIIEGWKFFSFFKRTVFANLSRMKSLFLLDQNFHEWRTLKSARDRFLRGCWPDCWQCKPFFVSIHNFLFQCSFTIL